MTDGLSQYLDSRAGGPSASSLIRTTALLATLCLAGCASDQPAPSGAMNIVDQAIESLNSIDQQVPHTQALGDVVIALGELGRAAEARALIDGELPLVLAIPDAPVRASALVGLAEASASISGDAGHDALMEAAWESLSDLESATKRSDLVGKLIVAMAVRDANPDVVEKALAMPELDDNQASFKARTLGKLAPLLAKADGADSAKQLPAQMTMGLRYYQAGAFADVAAEAFRQQDAALAEDLLSQAEQIARAQNDGYFVAGALRRIAGTRNDAGQSEQARNLFRDAADAAVQAETAQQRARAISRVAGSLADHQLYSVAKTLLDQSNEIAATEKSDQLRFWTYYEIAGSAAFAGNFDMANELAGQIPEDLKFSGASVRYAAERDIAWGYAKHRQLDRAVEQAKSIRGLRERTQALARIARIANNPDMRALSRYL